MYHAKSHTKMIIFNIFNQLKHILSKVLVAQWGPYYTMRFPYVALAIKPNANGMYMQRKWFYLYYSMFFNQNVINVGSYLLIMNIFSQYSIIMSDKKNGWRNPLRFLQKNASQKRIV